MSSATVPSLRITKSALRAFSSIGICASIFPSLSRREAGLTSLPPGAAAPRRGRPLEAVLALQLLEGDPTGGLVPSPRAVDQVNEVRAMAQGEGLEVQTATDRHHGRHGFPRRVSTQVSLAVFRPYSAREASVISAGFFYKDLRDPIYPSVQTVLTTGPF